MEKLTESVAELLPGQAPLASSAAELALRMLEQEFGCELGNHAIGSESIRYPSASEARLAMMRLAYEQGRSNALMPIAARDFEADAAAAQSAGAGDTIEAAQRQLSFLKSMALCGQSPSDDEQRAVSLVIQRLDNLRAEYVRKRDVLEALGLFEQGAGASGFTLEEDLARLMSALRALCR